MTAGLKWTKADYDAWAKRRLARPAEQTEATAIGSKVARTGLVNTRNSETGGNYPTLADCKSKYGNVPTDGEASKRQAKRLAELRLLAEAGHIRGLARQPEYVLIPKQVRECGELVERKMTYVADFLYEERNAKTGWHWQLVVEDAKGYRTPGYVQKRKLMLAIHGIEVRET